MNTKYRPAKIDLEDKKIESPPKLRFILTKLENNDGNGEIAGCQHFLLFPE